MRPVTKYPVDKEIKLHDGETHTIMDEYDPYGNARPYLLHNLGYYCSYCENCLHNGTLFDTEHIQPKSKHPELEHKWENFLIGCRACNGPGGKWESEMPEGVHLPHVNNTYKSFVYKEAGVVEVNPYLSELAQKNATCLLHWLKLDKEPIPSDKDKDGRLQMRKETWAMAEEVLKIYESGQTTLSLLMTLIKQRGGWSIWFTVFKNHDEVRKALIEEFPGTASECFDPENHYEPKDRNNGSKDPT